MCGRSIRVSIRINSRIIFVSSGGSGIRMDSAVRMKDTIVVLIVVDRLDRAQLAPSSSL